MSAVAPGTAKLVEDWLAARAALDGVAAKTVEAYQRDALGFLSFLAVHFGGPAAPADLRRLGQTDMRAWMAHERRRGISPRSLARALSAGTPHVAGAAFVSSGASRSSAERPQGGLSGAGASFVSSGAPVTRIHRLTATSGTKPARPVSPIRRSSPPWVTISGRPAQALRVPCMTAGATVEPVRARTQAKDLVQALEFAHLSVALAETA